MSSLLRKYGVQADIYFPLIVAGANDFASSGDYTHASGDVKVSKDGGASATATNAPSVIAMGNGGSMWKLTLTATEMQAAKVMVTIIDASTKAVEDQMILIETYGSASGEHLFDLGSLGYPLKKGVGLDDYTFVMADNTAPKTGLTVTAERSIDGGSFASCSNSVSEVASGTYKIDLSTSDLNGNVVVLKFTASGANPTIHTLILPT